MPKLKPHKGILKRMKVTKTGKVIRRKANKGHLMSSKTGKRRRNLGRAAVAASSDMQRLRRMLGI